MAAECHPAPRFRPLAYAAQLAATFGFFALGMLVSPLGWLAFRISGGRIPSRMGQLFLRQTFRVYVRWMQVTGTLRLDVRELGPLSDARGTIFVSNHPSLLDALFFLAHLPPAACVMRASLRRNPALAGGALAAGYITNDSGPAFVRQGIEKIRRGENLLVFPEGTRTISRPLDRFKHGFALVAARTGAPVRAVAVEYSGAHLSKGVSLLAPAEIPLKFTLRAGPEFRRGPDESVPEFSRRIEAWFRNHLGRASAG